MKLKGVSIMRIAEIMVLIYLYTDDIKIHLHHDVIKREREL